MHRIMPTMRSVLLSAAAAAIFVTTTYGQSILGPPNEAVPRLAALGVDYVAFCPGAPERHNYAAAAPEGFAAALSRGLEAASSSSAARESARPLKWRATPCRSPSRGQGGLRRHRITKADPG